MTSLEWIPDILPGYEAASLGRPASGPLHGGDGELARTLVRRIETPARPRLLALIVHGYNDYFFATHLADVLAEADCAVYAVDMRRAGRSLRPGNQPHHIAHIAELGDDISDAAGAARDDAAARGLGDLPLVVHAHSTGALAAAVWASDRPDPALAGLVLDGPFFGLALPAAQRALMRVTPVLGRVRPLMIVDPARSPYTQGLIDRGWEFDSSWKSPAGIGATAGWLAATRAAQARARAGLDIRVPVLVASSDSTGPDRLDNPRHASQDTVVDVTVTARLATQLGTRVDAVVIPDALHDLALSAPVPRARYLEAMTAFLRSLVR